MASTKLMETADGRRFWKISVSRGYGKSPYTTRFYWPEGFSARSAERALNKFVAEYELRCSKGEVLNREEQRQMDAEARAEAAKLKTVRQYAEGVFMPDKEVSISENTRSSYQMFIDNHILPVLGDVLLTDVTPAMITKLLLDYQRAGHAHASTIKLYNILNGMFKMAFMDDSIPISPMLKVSRPAPRSDEVIEEGCLKALYEKALRYVLDCVKKEPLKWQAYIQVAADTGVRRGENCGIQWKDIDFEKGVIKIHHNLQYTPKKGVYDKWPKNKKAREVDIGPETIAILKEWRAEQARVCISPWVFNKDGTTDSIFPQSPTQYFAKFGKRYGIPNFHPHLLRHTSASIMVTNGADIASVADRLGHTDKAVTLRMYTHANAESIRRAGQIARDALKVQGE